MFRSAIGHMVGHMTNGITEMTGLLAGHLCYLSSPLRYLILSQGKDL